MENSYLIFIWNQNVADLIHNGSFIAFSLGLAKSYCLKNGYSKMIKMRPEKTPFLELYDAESHKSVNIFFVKV